MGGKIASLVVIKGSDENVAKDVAMQSAAMIPKYVSREEVPSEVIEAEVKEESEKLPPPPAEIEIK